MLQFAVGDVIEVLQLDETTQDGYWLGRANGQVFPIGSVMSTIWKCATFLNDLFFCVCHQEGHFHSGLVQRR